MVVGRNIDFSVLNIDLCDLFHVSFFEYVDDLGFFCNLLCFIVLSDFFLY